MAIGFAKIIGPYLGQDSAVMIIIGSIYFVVLVFSLGTHNLLKYYYILKYSIKTENKR